MSRLLAPALAAALALALPLLAAAEPEVSPPAPPTAEDAKAPKLPGIVIDRENKRLDLEATVVLRDGEWLELLACSPESREHESIVTVSAKPSHLHMALLLIGAQPGQPMKWRQDGDAWVSTPPKGDQLAATFLVTDAEGKTKEVPANHWVVNKKTGKVLEDNLWLFAGSQMRKTDDGEIYMADLNGTLLSLVNFGDDVLARKTLVTRDNDEQTWDANTVLIPKEGTKVTLRLTLVKSDQEKAADAAPE